ncbi:MAG: ABC transporter permease [Chromatiales bacterium]|nr:ABC transporter permease [Chromatiales bacterium]
MNSFLLGARTARRRPLPAILTVLLLALGIATVVVVLLFQRALEDRLGRDARGIDLVVGAKGSGLQLVLSSVFHADVPTGNVPLPELRDIARHPMVAGVIPLSLGDSYGGFRIVGTSHDYVRHYGGRLAGGRLWERPMEAVMGSRAARETGLRAGESFVGAHGLGGVSELLHGEHPFEVVGILHATGTVLDRLILTGSESVWVVHAVHGGTGGAGAVPVARGLPEDSGDDAGAGEGDAQRSRVESAGDAGAAGSAAGTGIDTAQSGLPAGDGEITALLVRFRSPIAALTLPRAINAGTALQAASPAAETARLFLLIGTGLDVFRAFAAILVAASALSLFIALWHAMHEQRYDLAVMRTLGATRGRILRFVLVQGAVLGAGGAVLGVALGHTAGWLAAQWLERARSVSVGALGWAPQEGLVVAGAVLIALAAAAVPAVRAWRLDVVAVLAERR